MTRAPTEDGADLSRAKQLLGAEQAWLEHAHNALRDGTRPFLSPEVESALKSDTYKRHDGVDPLGWTRVGEDVGSALNAVLSTLAQGLDPVRTGHLDTLMDVFAAGGLTSVGVGDLRGATMQLGGRWMSGDTRLQAVVLAAATSDHAAGRFTALLLHVLGDPAGSAAAQGLHVSMPVLVHNERAEARGRPPGEVATLTLRSWPGGPPGLHPDPAWMAFSTIDDAARVGMDVAASRSDHRAAGTCITWSLRAADGSPVRELKGESLSAAIAVLLHELTTGTGRWRRAAWKVRPRRLSRRWTLTAGLRGDQLTRVRHYDSKLAAAATATQPLRVIVASELQPDELSGAPGTVQRVDTVADAVRLTRTLNRTFAAGVAALLLVTAALAGVGTWAKHSVDTANTTAERRGTSAELIKQSHALLQTDPRLAALAALASDDLDPSIRTKQAMADVLQANNTLLKAGRVSSTYVDAMLVAADTLLVVDGDGRLTAWTLPDLTPLGELEGAAVQALGEGSHGADFVALRDGQVHYYQGRAGHLPREVRVVDSRMGPGGRGLRIFGDRWSTSVLVLDDELNGSYWDSTLTEPFRFSLGDDVRVAKAPGRRSTGLAAAGAESSFDRDPAPEGSTDLAGLLVATDADEVLQLTIRADMDDLTSPRVAVTTLMPAWEAKGGIRAVAPAQGDTLLVATDRGVQWWDPAVGETKEFPYAGWSERVDAMPSTDQSSPVLVSHHRVGIIDEPVDERPRRTPVALEVGGPVITSAAAGDVQTGTPGRTVSAVVVGKEDGSVLVLDPEDTRFGPGDAPGSNVSPFTRTGHLLLTEGPTPQGSTALYAKAVRPHDADGPDPYEVQYSLPLTDGVAPYVNDADDSGPWVAASGRSADGRGAIWIWHRAGGDVAHVIPFGQGEGGGDSPPDIVGNVAFVNGGRELAAYNSASGVVGFWSAGGDWKQVSTIPLRAAEDADQSFTMRSAASADGRTMAVREGAHTIRIIDVASHAVVRTIDDEAASYTDLALSPDGGQLAVIDHLHTVRLLALGDGAGSASVPSRRYAAAANHVTFDPAGDTLAVSFALAGQVQLAAADTLEPLGPPWSAADGDSIVSLDWSPDGELLSAQSIQHRGDSPVNGSTHLLDAGSLSWRDQLCAIATDAFTRAEWRKASGGSALPRPTSCDWEADATSGDGPRAGVDGSAGLTLDDLMAGAPVPSLCEHEAGTLVLGTLPNQDPYSGSVSLGRAAFGDLTGDGVDDAAAIVACNAGGVPWPPWFLLYTEDADGHVRLLGAIESSDPALVGTEGSGRPFADDIRIEEGAVRLQYSTTLSPDAACCGSLPVDVSLGWDGTEVTVVGTTRHFDVAAVNQALNDEAMLLPGDRPLAPEPVMEAIDRFRRETVGVTAGTCSSRRSLPDELAARVAADPGHDDGDVRWCTVVGAEQEHAEPLLLRLVPGPRERYTITGLVE